MRRKAFSTEVQPSQNPSFNGFLSFQGIPIDIEDRLGDVRSGVTKDGRKWSTPMHAHYGEIRSEIKGVDQDKLDVYVGPSPESQAVVVVRQLVPETGAYDEDKIMLGFPTWEAAIDCYQKQYDRPGFYGGHIVRTMQDLKAWLGNPSNSGQKIARRCFPQTQMLVLKIARSWYA